MGYRTSVLQPVDICVEGVCPADINPYSLSLAAQFTGADSYVRKVPGFYLGGNTWCVRFSEETVGEYEYQVQASELENADNLSGKVLVEDEKTGLTRQLYVKGDKFVLSDGSDQFLMGYECDFLFSMFASPGGEEKTKTLIEKIKKGGFNEIILNAYAYDLDWNLGRTRANDYGPPYIELWNKTEDGREYNPDFFKNLDRLIQLLHENGIYVEMYYKVYNKMVPWPERYSEEEKQYLHMLTARYQAYPNMIWNFSKEGYFEKDKDYIFDCLTMIRNLDSYHHLCTIHDDLEYALDGKYEKTIDFLTLQQQGEMGHACLYYGLRSGKPVVNGEYGNECGPNGILDTPAWKSYSAEDNAQFGFQSVMAGAYITYYYAHAAWDVIEYEHDPKGFRYFRNLRDFFEERKFSGYHPAPELCAWSGLCLVSKEADAEGNREMLVYGEPKDERLYLLYWTGQIHMNPSAGKEVLSVVRKGMFTGEEKELSLEGIIGKDGGLFHGSMILQCSPVEPCIFIVKYKSK